MACFHEIPSYQRQIRLEIVYEVYVNTNHPEEYTGFIPDICSSRVKKYTSRFQNTFFFRIWNVWEERNYIKLYPAIQLWELHRVFEQSNHETVKYTKNDFNADNDAKYAAKEFVRMAYNTTISGTHSIQESKTVLLYNYESTFEDSDNRVQKMTRFFESLHLGRIGSKAHEEFLWEQD